MRTGNQRFSVWPMGIFAAFGFFIAGLGVLVAVAVASRSDLVVEDYYEQELRYQTQIDRARRTESWSAQVEISYLPTFEYLHLRLPPEHRRPDLTGELHLYRPSAAGMDRHIALKLDADGEQRIGAGDLAPGLWKARLQWSVGGAEYFVDRRLVIPGAAP